MKFIKVLLYLTVMTLISACTDNQISLNSKGSLADSMYQARWPLSAPDLHDMLVQIDPSYALMPKSEKEREMTIRNWSTAILAASSQPELADSLIADLTMPEIDSSYLRAAHYGNFGAIFLSTARQPEFLDWISDHILPVENDSSAGKTKIEQLATIVALSKLIDSFSSQPEIKDTLLDLATDNLPTIVDVDDPLLIVGRVYLVGYAMAALASQPELSEEIFELVELAGPRKALTSKQISIVRPYLLDSYLNAYARQPEMRCTFIEAIENETGILLANDC